MSVLPGVHGGQKNSLSSQELEFWTISPAMAWLLSQKNVFSLSLFLKFYISGFWDRVSLCSPGCPGAHSVDHTGLELRNPPASASQVLGLKACATMPSFSFLLMALETQWSGLTHARCIFYHLRPLGWFFLFFSFSFSFFLFFSHGLLI